VKRPVVFLAMGALSLIAAHAMAADPAPPPGPGLDLINERCGFCHTTGQVFVQRKSATGWAATVQSMADRGAELSPEEAKTITDYLAAHYGAPAPAAQ
jgi:mono/diheme cytochrome c family protein